jgi:hypothetical protein
MKKIILSIIISSISISALAGGVFNMQIPQPDFVSNDWDNDGDPNSTDPDDDNDGINDEIDSFPFGQSGQSSTPNVIVNSFSSDKISYFPNEDITLSWSIDNIRSLNIFDDILLTSHIADVTSQTSIVTSPIGDATYYLDFETGVSSIQVFEYKVDTTVCSDWSPDASTITSGQSFLQTRSCNVLYSSLEPNNNTIQVDESKSEIGTWNGEVCGGSSRTWGYYSISGDFVTPAISWNGNWLNNYATTMHKNSFSPTDSYENYALILDNYRYWIKDQKISGRNAWVVCKAPNI